jgi:IKI3 family
MIQENTIQGQHDNTYYTSIKSEVADSNDDGMFNKFAKGNFGMMGDHSDDEDAAISDEEAGGGSMMMQRFMKKNESIESASAGEYVIIQAVQSKSVQKISLEKEKDTEDKLFTLPHLCFKLNATYLNGTSETVVCLSNNMRLYLNDKLLSNECTSFTLSQSFLAFVNSTSGLSHELFIYDLNRSLPVPSTSNNNNMGGNANNGA